MFGTSKLLNINDATKRIGNFFKLPIQLFHGVPYPELALIVCASAPGNYTVTLPDRYAMRPFTVMDNNADMSIDANITSGDIRFRADRQGFFALGFGDDNDDITIDSCANRFLREI